MFVIDVIFRSGKYWASFDVDEWASANDGETHMRITTHGRSPLLENCDYDRTLFIN